MPAKKTEPIAVDLSEFDTKKKTPCTVASLVLDAQPREKLDAALAAPRFSAWKIAKVVRGWGLSTSDDSITKHRKGECDCVRPSES